MTTRILVSTATGKPVRTFDEVTTFRGVTGTLTGATPPQAENSTGRIYVNLSDGSTREFYPSVCNLEWRHVPARVQALIDAVKEHALDNYERQGWDIVVETMTDRDLAALIMNCRTRGGAISKVRRSVAGVAERRAEVRAEIF